MILADSDVLIDALRGRHPVGYLVREALIAGRLATTAITVFELLSGARTSKEREKVSILLAAMTVLPFGVEAAARAGEIRRVLEAAGNPIGMADYLIAGICLAAPASLWTRNIQHFERVPGLAIIRPDRRIDR